MFLAGGRARRDPDAGNGHGWGGRLACRVRKHLGRGPRAEEHRTLRPAAARRGTCPLAAAGSAPHTPEVCLREETWQPAKSRSVFFVLGICSQGAICPRQQAHVFLLIPPSPLLVWTAHGGGHGGLGVAQRQGGSGGSLPGLWRPLSRALCVPDPRLCFRAPALQMAGMTHGVCPSRHSEGALSDTAFCAGEPVPAGCRCG